MLRTFLAVTSVFALLAFFAFCAWYLAHPENWNWRNGELSNDATVVAQEPIVVEARFVDDRPVVSRQPAAIRLNNVRPQASATTPLRDSTGTASVSEEVVAASCALPEAVSVSRSGDSVVYSWRDERGNLNINFEEPPPAGVQARRTSYSTDPEYFVLTVEYRGQNADPDFRNQLTQDATSIYKVFAELIGEDSLRKVNLNIVLYPDSRSYLQYANTTTGRNMRRTAGFYSPQTNEAVTYIQSQTEMTMRTARHESTHLIATGTLGLIPLWLQEGLAEYFSLLDVNGQSARIPADDSGLQLARESLARGYPRRFGDLLRMNPVTWRNANQSSHYALAGSLVFFMMSNDRGRRVLSSLLQETASKYCQRLDTTQLLDRLYPGGITNLESEFFDWLRDTRPKRVHAF